MLCVTALVLVVQTTGEVRLGVVSSNAFVPDIGQVKASPCAIFVMLGVGGAGGGGGGETVKAVSNEPFPDKA